MEANALIGHRAPESRTRKELINSPPVFSAYKSNSIDFFSFFKIVFSASVV